jgi:nitrite reductase (NO-forming)
MSSHVPAQPTSDPSALRKLGAWTALGAVIGAVALILGGGLVLVSSLTAPHPSVSTGSRTAGSSTSSGATAGGSMSGMTGTTSVDSVAASAVNIPEPITRTVPTTVNVNLTTSTVTGHLDGQTTYTYWTFNGTVPGPMLRVMQGDTVVIHLHNSDSAMFHSIDLHAVSGPGGGSVLTQTAPGKDSTFSFKALQPGLYVYHCATPPVSTHIANGMYGMILVEPPGGLPKVDHEFYLVQSEFYTGQPAGTAGLATFSNANMMLEHPTYVVFNGETGAFMGPGALHAKVGEKIRLFVGVGTWLPSNFHVIGGIFDNYYPEGGIGGTVEHNIQTVIVPAGGTAIVEFSPKEPGTYTFVDHSMPHMDAGAMGQIVVDGPADPSIYRAGI